MNEAVRQLIQDAAIRTRKEVSLNSFFKMLTLVLPNCTLTLVPAS